MKKLCFGCLLLIIFSMIIGCSNSGKSNLEKWNCIDVTSYDHNRNNDMKCTSSNGKVQYTSYEGAKMLMSF